MFNWFGRKKEVKELNSLSDYDKLNSSCVVTVNLKDGKVMYLRIASTLNFDLIATINDKEKDPVDRMCDVWLMTICDCNGRLIFDKDNPEHVKIVREFRPDVAMALTDAITDYFGIKKKK